VANIIKIKRSSGNLAPSSLKSGELAYSYGASAKKLFFGSGDDGSGNATSITTIGGEFYTGLFGTAGTLNTAASSVPVLSATGTIDKWYAGNIYLNANTISATNTNGNITLTPNGTGYVVVSGTNGLVIPTGTTAQQGPAVTGAIRYNTTTSTFEGYNASAWSSLGGVRSVDGKAYIIAETSPGAANDTLQFYASSDGTGTGTSTKYLDFNGLGFKLSGADFSINTNKFTVANSTGNTLIAGTLNVTGHPTLEGVTATGATGTGNLVFSAAPTITGNVTLQGVTSTGATGTGNIVFSASPTFTGTLTAATISATTIQVNNLSNGYTTTATAAGTTTLTATSTYQQFFTGSTTQTVVLPVASTLTLGTQYQIVNTSTGLVTVQSSGANNILVQPANTAAVYTAIAITGTGTASWSAFYDEFATITGDGSNVLSNSPTFTGNVTIPNANYISVGTPAQGTLNGGTTLTTSTSITDSVGLLNQTLSLLTPAAPPAFPNAVSLTVSGLTTRVFIQAAGSQPLNSNTGLTVAAGSTGSVSRAATLATNTITGTGPGTNGTLTVNRNTASAVTKLLTYGNSTQVITGNITGTTNGTATVAFTKTSTGVIVSGYLFTTGASGAFGGLSNSTTYIVTAVTATTLTLAAYASGAQGAAFSATSTASGTLGITSATDNGTYTANNTSLVVSNNVAYPVGTPGFFETVDLNVTGTTVPAGWNTVQIVHNAASSTNTAAWYYDNYAGTAPTVASQTFALNGSATTLNSSTIPHYTSATSYNIGFTLTWNWGNTGHTSLSSNILTGSANSGAFQAPTNYSYTGLGISSTFPATLTVTAGSDGAAHSFTSNIVTGFGAQTTTTTVPTYSADNSYSTVTITPPNLGVIILFKTGTVGSTTVIDETSIVFNSAVGGSTTPVAFRVNNPDSGTPSDNPVFTAGAAAFSTLVATDAIVVGTTLTTSNLKWSQTNYSTGYLPVGPNLTTQNASQYFTFKFVRTGTSKFGIVFTTNGSTTGVAGIWCAMPGSITGYPSGSTNQWLSMAVDNSVSGGCALGGNLTVNGANATYTLNCSFGTASSSNATSNEIWVRIKLTSGQSISALYLQASTV
jgi:hypothetical protein